MQSNQGRFGSWHQHNISLVTGPDGKIIRIEANLPDQDDAVDAEEAGDEKQQGRAGRIHKLPTNAIEPVPKDYLFRENWRPWLTKQVLHYNILQDHPAWLASASMIAQSPIMFCLVLISGWACTIWDLEASSEG